MHVVGCDYDVSAIHLVKASIDRPTQASYTRCELPVWKRRAHTPTAPRDWDVTRLRAIADALPHSSYWDDVHSVILEHPAGRYGLHSTLPLYGALCVLLPHSPLVLGPSEWRKMIGLSGRATKDEVALWSISEGRAGVLDGTWTSDACDAYAIARAGMTWLDEEESSHTPQAAPLPLATPTGFAGWPYRHTPEK